MDKNYDSKAAEQHLIARWETEKTYAPEQNPGPVYSIDTPPPTVSGSLHIGHIFSYTQTDIIARYQRMKGRSVLYPFGFDDNGLATERFVEKKLDIVAHKLPRAEFIKLCLQESALAAQEFKQLWQSIGLSADWSATYSTISELSQQISQQSFIDLYKKGFIYRKKEPALYCTTCRTAVAQAELEDKEVPSTFNDIIFTAQDGSRLTVSTTRPELLSSCVALLHHPDDIRYQNLAHTKVTVPVFNNTVPVYADESVIPEKGTGLVMVCTFGDKTDIHWFKKFKLPYKPSVGLDGRWTADTGPLVGLKAADARVKILELLKKQNLLVGQKQIVHTVNVHERCKKEIEYLMLTQWFVKLIDHKQRFLDLANEISWYPAFMKSRYVNWVENISWDWCISRQRFYGIPFPAWHCIACDSVILAHESQLPIDPQTAPAPQCPCGSSQVEPDRDVMDTWNTSSITPYICKEIFGKDNFLPMSMRPQAHDIIRTWAFYTIAKAWMHDNTIPWKDIVISGHVLSGKEKLSKSAGNAKLEPKALLETYSADAVRYWTASASLGQDVPFSDNQLKIGQRLATKLWNAFRFVEEHSIHGFWNHSVPASRGVRVSEAVETSNVRTTNGVVNQWILHQASLCFAKYHASLDAYEFNHALTVIDQFFWNDFCDNYLELIKNQLFNPSHYPAELVAETKATLADVGLRILQMYAPFVPFVTDSIFENLSTKGSLHNTKFADTQTPRSFVQSANIMTNVLMVIAAVRRNKTERQLSLKTELEELTISAPETVLNDLRAQEQLIKGVTQAKTVTYLQGQELEVAIRS